MPRGLSANFLHASQTCHRWLSSMRCWMNAADDLQRQLWGRGRGGCLLSRHAALLPLPAPLREARRVHASYADSCSLVQFDEPISVPGTTPPQDHGGGDGR